MSVQLRVRRGRNCSSDDGPHEQRRSGHGPDSQVSGAAEDGVDQRRNKARICVAQTIPNRYRPKKKTCDTRCHA